MKTKRIKPVCALLALCVISLLIPAHAHLQEIQTPWNWRITGDYGPRLMDELDKRFHKGIDYEYITKIN